MSGERHRLIPAGRPAAAVIADVHADCFADPWSADSVAALFAVPGTLAWLAVDPDGRPDATLMVRVLAGQADILTLAVRPGARRQGLAVRLLGAAEWAVSRAGPVEIFLEVAESNAAAIALYRAAGFAESGRRRNYYTQAGTPIDALVMCKTAAGQARSIHKR